jgi:secreted PhoX family phosphatase
MKLNWQVAGVCGALATVALVACSDDRFATRTITPSEASDALAPASASFQFTGLASSTVCTNGGDINNLMTLPPGFAQTSIASEPSFADVPDMTTQNETGPSRGRYVYQTHELGSNASVSVTDLMTGQTKTLVQRSDWEALDGLTWTPWGTLLFDEETNAAGRRDPNVPQAVAGLVYEIFLNPNDLTVATNVVARPAIGSKSHEGMKFDADGNLYSISERTPGYIFKFVPDTKGDLSAGQTYVMKVVEPDGGVGTGTAIWVALDRTAVQIDASAAADAVGATGYGRPEDLEWREGMLFAAITSEHRVIVLRAQPNGRMLVYNFVARGLNTTAEFDSPDNLAIDPSGNIYITEDPGGNTQSGKKGDDIWVAGLPTGPNKPAGSVKRFASMTDCEGEPTGLYFDITAPAGSPRLFVHMQHRGGDRLDKTLAITKAAQP